MAGIKIDALPAVVTPALTDVFPIDQGAVTYKESLSQVISLFRANGAALTEVNDTNVTMTLAGSPTTALLNATSMTLGWTGQLAETRGGTAQSTYTLGDTLYSSAANTLSKLAGNITAVKQYLSQTGTGAVSAAPAWATIAGNDITGAALSKTDDTNVTMTLGGTPTTALLRGASMTLGWTGQLSVSRGGTGIATTTPYSVICAGTTATGPLQSLASLGNSGEQLTSNGPGALPTWQASGGVTPAALTKVDDTNVTLTLGGTPSTALLQATSLTIGWTGQLSLARGGTNASLAASNGGIFYSTATAGAILSGTATANLPLLSGSSAAPTWGSFALNLGGAFTTGGAVTYSGAFSVTFTFTAGTSVTFPTSGTLATTTQLPTPAALTKTDDTNVTMTLGGTPTTALLQATSLTLGWTGQLSLARGGTAANLTASNGGIFYSTASAGAILSGTATAGLALLSGASGAPTWSASKPITRINTQYFLATGTYTPTAGMVYCDVEAVGGGGGGGGITGVAAQASTSGGGGSGTYSRSTFDAATIGASKAVAIGAGGAAGAAANGAGGNGGTTTLGTTLLTAPGGTGCVGGANSVGGAGGIAGTAGFTTVGTTGGNGIANGLVTIGALAGCGGSSVFGGGGPSPASTTASAGNPGQGYGSGGSGATVYNSAGSSAGGAGAPGLMIIREYISV